VNGHARVVFVGRVLDVAVACAVAGHHVVGVVGHGGRPGLARLRRAFAKTPAERAADALGARFVNVSGRGLGGVVDEVKALRPDVIVCAAWPGRLPAALLQAARCGGVNVHPSRLPEHRGPDPLAWTILGGDTTTALSMHQMVHDLDAGGLYCQHDVVVLDDDTRGTLGDRCFRVAVREVGAVVSAVVAGETPTPQGPGGGYERHPRAADLALVPHLGTIALLRRLRAQLPRPVRLHLGDVSVHVVRALALPMRTATAGHVSDVVGEHVGLATVDGTLWLTLARAPRGLGPGAALRIP
jgi:methionyl-tRNA formyltransferase